MRGERRTCLHRAQHVLVNQDGLGEALAAVDDAVADGADLVHGGDDAVLRVNQRAQHLADRLGVGGHRQLLRVADGSAGQLRLIGKAAVKADALAQPLRQKHTRLRVEQLVLQRRASCVDYKYIHGGLLFSINKIQYNTPQMWLTRLTIYSFSVLFVTTELFYCEKSFSSCGIMQKIFPEGQRPSGN